LWSCVKTFTRRPSPEDHWAAVSGKVRLNNFNHQNQKHGIGDIHRPNPTMARTSYPNLAGNRTLGMK